MNTSLLHLCLIVTAFAGAHADTVRTLPVCPPDLPEMPRPIRPCIPLPPTADPWDQVVFNDRDDGCCRHHHHHHCHSWRDLAVNGQDDGCVKLPGKPARPTPTSTTLLPA